MNRAVRTLAVLLIALATLPLLAESRSLVDDVIRMYKSGVPEDAIIQFMQKTDGRFEVTADDLIALADAKVPRTIIKAVLDESDVRNGRDHVRDTRTVVVERPVYRSYYDPWYYDPFWYGPRFSFDIGLGFYQPFYGGFYGYRGWGGHGWGGGHRGGIVHRGRH
jgi:hypothetical protein